MIPPFDERGNLPPGIHRASWVELETRFGKTPWRRALLLGMQEAFNCLHRAGCRTAYVDGSFVTARTAPGDYDACWETAGVDFNLLDPALLDFSAGRQAQKQRYGGELFPARMAADPEGTPFLELFQYDHANDRPKGIVEINLESEL